MSRTARMSGSSTSEGGLATVCRARSAAERARIRERPVAFVQFLFRWRIEDINRLSNTATTTTMILQSFIAAGVSLSAQRSANFAASLAIRVP